MTDALARELRRRRLHELVVSYEQEKGTITAKELAAIQATNSLSRPPPSLKRGEVDRAQLESLRSSRPASSSGCFRSWRGS